MNGQTIILNSQRAREELIRLARVAPHGFVANVREPTRTSDQNAKMHAMLSDVSRAKPGGRSLSPEKWKCLFMDAVAAETGNAAFISQWLPNLNGDSVVNTGYRSSKLTKSEMGELLDFIEAWGTENGVHWTTPEDERRAA